MNFIHHVPLNRQALLLLMGASLLLLNACTTRHVQDSMAGSTAQRLVTHSIDDLIAQLPDSDFQAFAGQQLYLATHFIHRAEVKQYADERLAMELASRFDIRLVNDPEAADAILTIFYTSLGTDENRLGFFIPLGFVPGVAETTQINLITLEQFHGISEMYYFLGVSGNQSRSQVMQARVRTDALGLPFITIPISNVDRD